MSFALAVVLPLVLVLAFLFLLFIPLNFTVRTDGRSFSYRLSLLSHGLFNTDARIEDEQGMQSNVLEPTGSYLLLNKLIAYSRFRALFIRSILNLISRSRYLLRLRINELKCTFGWDDPENVAFLFGVMNTAISLLTVDKQGFKYQLEPSFFDERFYAEVNGALRVYPGRLFLILLLFVVEFPFVQYYRLVIRAEGKQ